MNRGGGGKRMRHEHAVTSSELACCPLPAQVFSQQLPNQHAIFLFRILKM
jgi:hypothetical protein